MVCVSIASESLYKLSKLSLSRGPSFEVFAIYAVELLFICYWSVDVGIGLACFYCGSLYIVRAYNAQHHTLFKKEYNEVIAFTKFFLFNSTILRVRIKLEKIPSGTLYCTRITWLLLIIVMKFTIFVK